MRVRISHSGSFLLGIFIAFLMYGFAVPFLYQPFPAPFTQAALLQPSQPLLGAYPYSKMSRTFQDLFANDAVADAILAGRTTINMFDYNTGYCYPDQRNSLNPPLPPGGKPPLDPYGMKILSGLRALGYNTDSVCDSWAGTHSFMRGLLHFQKDHHLPYSNFVDAPLLRALQQDLAAIQTRDRTAAKSFPCYQYLVPAPPGEVSKEHVAYLYHTAMSVFPKRFQIRNRQDCFNPQHAHHVSVARNFICSQEYYSGWYDDQCNLLSIPKNYNTGFNDFQTFVTWLHEYTHTLDGKIDTRDFYDISYDVDDRIDGFYRMRPNMPTFPDDGQDNSLSPRWAGIKQHFFSYAPGWESDAHPGYFTAAEDFAVSVGMYVVHGAVFRDYMQDKEPLKKKYAWIKKHVFDDKEFNTGDLNYKEYSPDLYFPPGGIVDAVGFVTRRPFFRLDYPIFKSVSKISPPANTPLDGARASMTEITEALKQLADRDRLQI